MNTFSLLLLLIAASMVAVVSSNTLRGSAIVNTQGQEQEQEQQEQQSRRQLIQGMTCTLFLKDVAYGPTEEQPNGYSQEEWVCGLPQEESSRLGGIEYVDIVDSSWVVANATSGQSTLTVSEAIFDIEALKMYIPKDALVEVQTQTRRNLADKTGTLKTLVIRIIDSQGVAPDADANQIRNDVFEDGVSLKTQYDKCSYGKLKIEPFNGKTSTDKQVNGGVVDVQVDFDTFDKSIADRDVLQQAAFDAANKQLGDLNNSDEYNLVMFCMPPGTGDWLAYAFVNNKFSFYNNQWCSSVSAQLHEVGHNLGLAHSGEVKKGKYDDQSGMMGFSYDEDDTNMCFNPAKNWQLGWYNDQAESINPLDDKNDPVQQFTLNGVSDYGKNKKALVVLQLNQPDSEKDYYIGYNRMDGINRDTVEDENMVTIIRKEGGLPTEYGQSMKVAKLNLGQSYVIENFNGQDGSSVEIKFVASLDGKDATIEVVDVAKASEIAPMEAEPYATYTIELTTDRYPDDNTWSIVEDGGIGRVYATNPKYTEQLKLYTTEVRLPYNKNYKFVIEDVYEDGLCCGQGEGSYRGLDPKGNELFIGGAKFAIESQEIQVGESPDSSVDTKKCKDKKGKFQWKKKKNKKKRKKNCKWIAKKNKCNAKGVDGNRLWQSCPNVCNRCADM